jgi:hypothetical protein
MRFLSHPLVYFLPLGAGLFLVHAAFSPAAQGAPSAIDDPCPPPKLRTNVRPDADGPPTEVSVGIRMIDLLEIDDVNQTLKVDIAIVRSWTDQRLAQLAGCEILVDDVWFPELVIVNSGRLFERWPREVSIGPGGQVKYPQRISGTLASHHKLNDFPFDEQVITIRLTPLRWSENEVHLSDDKKFTGMTTPLNISDWNIESVRGVIGRQHIDAFDRIHSSYDFMITATRIRSYYVWKVILPLCLIVAMSWCVFWIDPAQFGPQIGLSATSMLTLIAFIFATTNMVPKLGHFTLLDLFIVGSTILVFLALIEALVTSYLVSHDRKILALWIDRVARLLFPLSFAAMAAVLFVPQL